MRSAATGESIAIPVGEGQIDADLRIPERAAGLVMFAHGSGSSRFSTRNRFVAGFLEANGFGTLLLDLLTREEEAIDVHTREFRFDIDRLARRVVLATDWAQNRQDLQALPVGYFGASTGAAAALVAAAGRPGVVRAIVSRGGRPDLANGGDTACAGQSQVHQGHVRLMFFVQQHGVLSGTGLGNDFHIGPRVDNGGHADAHQGMVVNDHNANLARSGMCGWVHRFSPPS